MKLHTKSISPMQAFVAFSLALLALLIVLAVNLAVRHAENDVYSFREPVIELSDGWTMADGAGRTETVSLPVTVPYGADGVYTLTHVLPDVHGTLASPAIRIYSNYVDLDVFMDGQTLYSYPNAEAAFLGATGNTYHFIRMPTDYAGKTVSIRVRGQLGDGITYYLTAPQFGSKATMLYRDVIKSLPHIMLAGCMVVLAVALGILFLALRKRAEMNRATLYVGVFALAFAVYVCAETVFAQLIVPNGYLLCFLTLILLAFLPIPLVAAFAQDVGSRLKRWPKLLIGLCAINLVVQILLNFSGVSSVRVMLPATHVAIIVSILGMSLCLLLSDRAEKPNAGRTLLSAAPMIFGGSADIILLNLNRPSINNSFYFTLGVTVFVVFQFAGFLRTYFTLFRTALEAKLLRDMAYMDMLTGIGDRNAYERKLKELSAAPLPEKTGCIVLDINGLKQINDTLGHKAGDVAIEQTGRLLNELVPDSASCFRTGGDEFIILLETCDARAAEELAKRIAEEADRRGKACAVPLSLAIGFGSYLPEDANVVDFIRRVDTLMYGCKRALKSNADYPFASVSARGGEG